MLNSEQPEKMIRFLVFLNLGISLAGDIPLCSYRKTHLTLKPLAGQSVKVGCKHGTKFYFCELKSIDGSTTCRIQKDGHHTKCVDKTVDYAGTDIYKDCFFIINPPFEKSEKNEFTKMRTDFKQVISF
jgi:hypothetical protein